MPAKSIIPAGFRSEPVLLSVSDLITERDMLLASIERIADTDSRCGLEMRGIANDVIDRLLEHRMDVKLSNAK